MAVEAALGFTLLVASLAALTEITSTLLENDRMGRAARAAAGALALDPAADACAAIRRELHLADDFDCATQWTVTVNHGLSPADLPETLDATVGTGTGDLVLVRIGWGSRIAVGLARSE